MDPYDFDRLARAVARPGLTRRGLLRGALGAGAAALMGGRIREVRAEQEKRALCHFTGNPTNPYTVITVAEPAWKSHFDHGDTEYVNCCVNSDCAGGGTCVAGTCLAPGGCITDADCAAVDPCTPAACVAGVCSAASLCPADQPCLRDRSCDGYTCEDTGGCLGICRCPRVGPFGCHTDDVTDSDQFIRCDDPSGPI